MAESLVRRDPVRSNEVAVSPRAFSASRIRALQVARTASPLKQRLTVRSQTHAATAMRRASWGDSGGLSCRVMRQVVADRRGVKK